MFFKYRLLQARIHKASNMCHLAHEISMEIMLYVRRQRDLNPAKYWMAAVKAAQIVDTQFCNAREFDDGLLVMEKVAMRTVDQLGKYFVPADPEDDSKVLQDNLYTFTYRKFVAQHHIYFMDYVSAEKQLRTVLEDELKYYRLTAKKEEAASKKEEDKKEEDQEKAVVEKKEEEKKDEVKPLGQRFHAIDFTTIDLSSLDDKNPGVEIKYTPRAHPLFKVVQTLLLLAECFSFSQKYEHTLEVFEFCQKVY